MELLTQMAPTSFWARGVKGTFTDSGIVAGATGQLITAPVLARTSPAGTSPLTWSTTIDATVYAGYFWRLQVDQTSNAFGAITQEISQMITPSEIVALDGSFPTFVQPSGLYYMRIRVEIDDGASGPGSGTNSAWSNVLTDTISAASTVWTTSTGASKSQYVTVSGSPQLVGTGTNGVGTNCPVRATAAKTGKKQFEVTYTTKVQQIFVGLDDGTTTFGPGAIFPAPGKTNSLGIVAYTSGDIFKGGVAVQTGLAVWAQGDVITLEFDTAGGTAQFYRNGSAYGTQLTSLSFSSWYAYAGTFSNDVLTANFGQNAFTHSLSSGYTAYG